MYYLCFDENKTLSYASAGRYTSRFSSSHPDRTLDTAVLLLGYSGSCPMAQDGREYLLKRGTFQVLFPGVRHYGTGEMSQGQSHFWCHFYLPEGYRIVDTDDPYELYSKGMCVIPEFAQIDDCEKHFILFSQLIDESENENASRAISDAYVKILLCSLSKSARRSGILKKNENIIVAAIKDWTKAHALRGGNVSQAARALKYDPDYLTRILKKHTGMTMSEYINGIRLQEAKSLLTNTDLGISEIAYAVGYSDEKYFMRVFKRCEQVTPTQYRGAHFKKHLN